MIKDNAAEKIKHIKEMGRSVSIFDQKIFGVIVGVAALIVVALVVYFVDFSPSLSHLRVTVFSGATTGNYHATVTTAADIARRRGGRIENIATNGSIDNIKRLQQTKKRGQFALAQNGMPWGEGIELVAHLRAPETVFFLGPNADSIKTLADLKHKRIGIGPKGSGTAHLAETIFNTPQFAGLAVSLSHHSSDEQLALLKQRKIDLGVFVISEKSVFIEKAVCEDGMQIASFRQSESIAMRLPFLKSDYIREGLYDPVRNLPASSKKVLKLDTLIVSNGEAKRSQVIGLLSVMSDIYPNLINYNRTVTNYTGLPESSAARDFFNNTGPEILDRYSPRLMDILPLSNLVQLAMAISIFFNLMGVGNRFFLWRIDANRIALEVEMRDFFGRGILPEEIEHMAAMEEHRTDDRRRSLTALIERLETLEGRCRKQSQGLLVPMGGEMAYRYQEEIISRNLVGLRAYRDKIA